MYEKAKRKSNVFCILFVVALVAAIGGGVGLVLFQRKYADADSEVSDLKKELERLKGQASLENVLLNTETSKRPGSTPVLMERKLKAFDETKDKIAKENFNVMQFNMLADGFCGLYDNENNPTKFEIAMEPENQHHLYWRYRLPLIIDEIISNEAHIVTLQENDHPEDIEDALNSQAAFKAKAKTEEEKTKGEGEEETKPNK